MEVLRFHKGRGGRFNNQGHLTFIGFEKIQDSNVWNKYFKQDNGSWKTEMGNELDYEIRDNGTGYINDDGDYDSDYWIREDHLSEIQVGLIAKETDSYFAKLYPACDKGQIDRILKQYYLDQMDDNVDLIK